MLEIAVNMAFADGVYDGVFLCCHFSHEMSWIGFWTNFSPFRSEDIFRIIRKILIGFDFCLRPSFLILWVTFDTIKSLNRLPYQI